MSSFDDVQREIEPYRREREEQERKLMRRNGSTKVRSAILIAVIIVPTLIILEATGVKTGFWTFATFLGVSAFILFNWGLVERLLSRQIPSQNPVWMLLIGLLLIEFSVLSLSNAVFLSMMESASEIALAASGAAAFGSLLMGWFLVDIQYAKAGD